MPNSSQDAAPAGSRSSTASPHRIFLFDVDGTLTAPRGKITASMHEFLVQLRGNHTVGIVGGSDLSKQVEQLGENTLQEWDYVFSENGLMAYKRGSLIGKTSLVDHLGEDTLGNVINFALRYLSNLKLPVKRGTFIEFRAGMLNISPIGRDCSQSEREAFEKYDADHHVRAKMTKAMQNEFSSLNLKYSIGGQISFDVFPIGWDKTYCLKYLVADGFKEIHFFGDKTMPGGNDHEIFEDDRTIGHSVSSPDDTKLQVESLLRGEVFLP